MKLLEGFPGIGMKRLCLGPTVTGDCIPLGDKLGGEKAVDSGVVDLELPIDTENKTLHH